MDGDVTLIEGEIIALEPETTVVVDGVETALKMEDNFVVAANRLRQLTFVPWLDESISSGSGR